MALVILGVVLLALKLLGLGPIAGWSWWWVVLPFALAALYWQFADSVGWTQRAAMRRADEKVKRRRDERRDALGIRPSRGGASRPPHGDPGSSRRSASPFPDTRPPDARPTDTGKPPARKD
jgi:small Trp-rich protein